MAKEDLMLAVEHQGTVLLLFLLIPDLSLWISKISPSSQIKHIYLYLQQ